MSRLAARAVALAAALSALGSASAATAACPRPLVEWGRACAAREGLRAQVTACNGDRAAVDVTLPSERLTFELRPGGAGFVVEGDVGISPVGQFDDWKAEPASRRDALDAVRRCVRDAAPPLDRARGSPSRASTRRLAPIVTTTTMAAALGLALALGLASARIGGGTLALACLAALASAGLRWWWLGGTYFHQNGQGPLWTAMTGHTTVYGPGYDEWMALPARLGGAHAERAIFVANAAFGALSAAFGFAVARLATGSRGLAWLTLAWLALDPVGARLAGSESYFTILTTLAWGATLAITLATFGPPRGRRLAVVAAALLVAAAARVHPVGWAPLAGLAFIPLTRPRGDAVKLAVTTALGVAVGVGLLAGAAMWGVLRGPIGEAWARASSLRTDATGARLALVAGLALLVASRGRRAALSAPLLVLGWAWLTFRLETDDALVAGAYLRLAAPPLVACGLALATTRLARRALVIGSVACGAWWFPGDAARARAPSTDALETTRALTWRERLDPDDDVCFVARASRAVFALPLGPPWAHGTPLDPSRSWSTAGCTHYYRPALCSTTDAGRTCEEVEAALRLEPLEVVALPARPSLPWLAYRGPSVEIGLYRIADARPRAR